MIHAYEIPVIFRIQPDDEMQLAIDQVIAWIETSTEIEGQVGQVTKIDRNLLGRRRLAYEIDGQRDGQYILFYADIDTRHLPELELNLKLYESVLRHAVFRDEESERRALEEAEETADDA